MRKFKVDRSYSEQVAQLALTLFDATQPSLHQLSPDAREILWAAAMLHNCGEYVSNSSYHKHTYYLIRNGELLGYTEADVEAIANLARYHRKSPPKKKHDNYRNLSTKWHRRVVDQLHPIMRLAVALNRRQIGAVASLSCELDLEQKAIYLHISPRDSQDDCALELWSIEQNKEAFEKTYGLRVVPILHGA